MFTHLHCHSNYSLLRGADTIETLVARAKSLGMNALAITDTDGLYGAIPFYKCALENGIKPVIGAEVADNKTKAVLLAMNAQGYSNLCRIVTEKKLSYELRVTGYEQSNSTCTSLVTHHSSPENGFSLQSSIQKHNGGLTIITSSLKLLRDLVNSGAHDNLFAELNRFSENSDKRIRRLLEFSKTHGVPLVAANDVYFACKEGYPAHRLLSAIRERSTVKTVSQRELAHREAYLKSEEEMKEQFCDIPEALKNTEKITQACRFEFELGLWKFPKYADLKGESSNDFLRRLCLEGVKKRYKGPDLKVLERLSYELSIIERLHLCDYFLIVWDINNFAKREEIPSVGRGSAADSLVSYLLFITNVDPIKHDLFFERFLNLERKDPPDIDLDFCWRRRDKVIDYVYKKYGSESTAMISTHVTFGGRSALREVTKALGIPIEEVSRYIDRLPHYGDVEAIEKAKIAVPECADIPIDKEPLKTIFEYAKRINGYPRHLSIHPGGIVISPSPITDFIPLELATKGIAVTQFDMYPVEDMGLLKIDLLGQRSLSVIDDTVRILKDSRGIQINFEGNVAQSPNTDRNSSPPPLMGGDKGEGEPVIDPTEDEKTVNLIKNGDTIGCFYIESPGMRLLLKKLKCDTFEGLVAASSIIRPGVSESGMMREFIERFNGTKPVTYLHPSMERHLKLTLGVMIYQEDVLKIANDLGGMSFGEADNLRRCMSKKRNWEAMEKYRDLFINGALKRGVSEEIAKEAWRQIESFAGYAFCKAHSASYAQISYQSAYLKAHYPAEFMASVISNFGGFYHTSEYVEEARRMGVKILLPDINRSGKYFTGLEGQMRVGLSQIKGIRDDTVKRIVEERKKGFFVSLADFLKRTDTGKKETEALIKCGAFDSFEFSRPELLWKLELHFSRRGHPPSPRLRRDKLITQKGESLELPFRYGTDKYQRIVPRIKDYSLKTKLRMEKEILGFTAQAHPLDLFVAHPNGKKVVTSYELRVTSGKVAMDQIASLLPRWEGIKGRVITPSFILPRQGGGNVSNTVYHSSPIIVGKDISNHIGKKISLIGWLVTSKRVRTKKGEMMKFLTMEDKTASFEVTLFPNAYKKCGAVLNGRGPYLVSGRVESEFGGITLTASEIKKVTSENKIVPHP